MKFSNFVLNLFAVKFSLKLANYFTTKSLLISNILSIVLDKFVLRNFYLWKTSNYADSYWFLYSNKKTLYESRFL